MKTLTVFALVCVMTALTGAAADVNLVKRWARGGCYGGWSRFNDRCFFYDPRPMTWAKAEKNCESLGGNLASVRNIMEYHELQRLIMTNSHEYKETWIGGTDAQEVILASLLKLQILQTKYTYYLLYIILNLHLYFKLYALLYYTIYKKSIYGIHTILLHFTVYYILYSLLHYTILS
uniref:C-type lectin domain-containing protein n=1 Tax=Sander lucioperca TaxID=283035 RepID=A0A8C9Z9M4_SANLU